MQLLQPVWTCIIVTDRTKGEWKQSSETWSAGEGERSKVKVVYSAQWENKGIFCLSHLPRLVPASCPFYFFSLLTCCSEGSLSIDRHLRLSRLYSTCIKSNKRGGRVQIYTSDAGQLLVSERPRIINSFNFFTSSHHSQFFLPFNRPVCPLCDRWNVFFFSLV